MTNQPNIEELTRRMMELLPASAEVLQEDVKKNLKAVLNAAFARMDLVTREEFDVQTQLLARTRERLEAMERQMAQLEAELLKARPPSGP
jgi:BMFP domain-containing protein YqiC